MNPISLIGMAMIATSFCTAAEPVRLLSGYGGYVFGDKPADTERALFIPMKKAGFNSVELKIQQYKLRRMDVKKHEGEVAELARLARKNGLVFQIYLYPEHYSGKRMENWPEHRDLPCFVTENGEERKTVFSLSDYRVWKESFRHAFDFAELSLKYPVFSLKFDIETISSEGISYDDSSWKCFCGRNPRFASDTPRPERFFSLQKHSAVERYRKFFLGEVDQAVRRLGEEIHSINPKLKLGVMPAGGALAESFVRFWGTPEAPVIIDDWCMYNGEGYSEKVKARRDAFRKLNPNSLFIPWFRINSYYPGDITVQAYHAGSVCDGYSSWTMGMLTVRHPAASHYSLPDNNPPERYWNAYAAANQAIRADIRENIPGAAKRIAYTPAKALVPPLDYAELTIPDLVPKGSGKGGQAEYVLRDQRVVFIYAAAGEKIKVRLRHLAGERRALSLHYALLDAQKRKLRNEAVRPGAVETFEVTAPRTGVYALVVTGGMDGQAWYGVQVFNPYCAFSVDPECYFFGAPFRIFIPGKHFGNTTLSIASSVRQAYRFRKNRGAWVSVTGKAVMETELGDGLEEFLMAPPEKPIHGYYTQDFRMKLPKGKTLYFYTDPERMLLPKEAK